ncbi:MAG: twin-arginine translocase TatA/TatE family subunit [Chloroflexi bacterium]|nr:MAG: twin-arginine translocase TatA/TatE family subunit [Chloroflexota bacterium]
MLGRFGWAELLVVLLIALLVFGPGRVGKLGKELGQGIRSFQEGLKEKDASADEDTGASDIAQ